MTVLTNFKDNYCVPCIIRFVSETRFLQGISGEHPDTQSVSSVPADVLSPVFDGASRCFNVNERTMYSVILR